MISDPQGVFVALALAVYVALCLEKRFGVFRSLGSALVGILICMTLSNAGILPGASPTYDLLMGVGVNVSIAFILLSVDVRTILRSGVRMMGAFAMGALGSAAGAILGALLFVQEVGPETWKLAGQFAGTYTGGGVNFAALGKALGTSSSLFTAAVAADVVVGSSWMAACLLVPVLLRRPKPMGRAEASAATQSSEEREGTLEHALHNSGRPVPIGDAAALVAIALGAVWLSGEIGSYFPRVPEVLWLTTIALLAAQLPPVRRLIGSAVWGNYLLLLFLASNGAKSVIANIFQIGPAVFYYAAFTVAVHGIVIFGLGRLLKLDMPTLAVASQASVGGAASALAIATARGYTHCVLPGVAVGLLGYAAGNYWGFLVAMLMRGWLPG